MSEMNEYTPELFELIDGNGRKREFELIDSAEINGEQYYVMVPAVEDENFLSADLEPVILKAVEENGEEVLSSIEDDGELDEISRFFAERMENFWDFDDDIYAD